MNQCPSTGQLAQLVDDQLSSENRAAVEEHVERCGQCQEELERLVSASSPEELVESATHPDER